MCSARSADIKKINNNLMNVFQDPKPFPYLQHSDPYTFDVDLEVSILPEGQPKESVVSRYLTLSVVLTILYGGDLKFGFAP